MATAIETVKIRELPSATSIDENDLLVIDQTDATKKATLIQVLDNSGVVKKTEIAKNTGASLVGTASGKTVQQEIDSRMGLSTASGASNVGTTDGGTVQSDINQHVTNLREMWRRDLQDISLTLVAGSFEEGGVLNSGTDALWSKTDGQCYVWLGAFPKLVPPESTPTSTGPNWVSIAPRSVTSTVNDAVDAAVDAQHAAEAAAEEAAGYVTQAGQFGNIYPSTTAGLAAVAEGEYFQVPQGSGSSVSFRVYRKVSGAAQEVANTPGTAAVIKTERLYPTLAIAQGEVAAGNILADDFCYVRSDEDTIFAVEYTNTAGTLQETGKTIPSSKVIEDIHKMIYSSDTDGILWNFVDSDGMSVFQIKTDGTFGTMTSAITNDGVLSKNLKVLIDGSDHKLVITDEEGFGTVIVDRNGVVAPTAFHNSPELLLDYSDKGWIVLSNGEFQKVIVDPNGDLVLPKWVEDLRDSGTGTDPFAERNQRNLAYSARIKGTFDTKVKRLTRMVNHILWYGQSLSSNQEGWPALSRTPYTNLDAFMVGDSSRPNSRTNANFVPIGSSTTLNPLKAVVQSPDGSTILTASQEAALAPGAVNEGEGGVACANMFKSLFLKQQQEDRDQDRKIVLSNTGVNGRTIEQLSKGASPELYNRPREAVALVKQAATTLGVPYGVMAIAWLQGEWNSIGSSGGTQDYQTYYNLMTTLFSDMRQDFAYANGQTDVPAVFMYQTGGQYIRDSNKLSIPMAQLDFCRISAGNHAYLCTPAYPFPDKGGHLTSNGYRWMDMQFAKVMFKVLVMGEGWEPLSPIGATLESSKTEVVIDHHVPAPPLQFRTSYNGLVAFNDPSRGYRLVDALGAVPLQSVTIAADTVISIKTGREISLPLEIYYASQSYSGNGNVFDSDATIATENYVYTAGSGQYAGENIPELVDKPYPLNNPCVAWYTKITE